MAPRKTPANVSIDELARIAREASRVAGEEARKAGITVAAIEVPSKTDHPPAEKGRWVDLNRPMFDAPPNADAQKRPGQKRA